MTRDREHTLRTAQRRMLRKIVQTGRKLIRKEERTESRSSSTSASEDSSTEDGDHRIVEDYVDWIKRATEMAEGATKKARVTDWVTEQARRKFLWAGHVARRKDGRWDERLLNWLLEGKRQRGRPKRR